MGLFDGLERDLKNLTKQTGNLNNVSVNVTDTDNVDSVARKLKAEIKRQNAYDPGTAAIRDIAKDMIKEARK